MKKSFAFGMILFRFTNFASAQIFQPLEYSQPIDNSSRREQQQNLNQSILNAVDRIDEKRRESLLNCQKNLMAQINGFTHVKPIENGIHKVNLLSSSRCEIVEVKVANNKISSVTSLDGDNISFNYSNQIESGHVTIIGRNHLDMEEVLHIYFHEKMFTPSSNELARIEAENNFKTGSKLLEQGKFKESIPYLTKAIEANVTEQKYYNARGWAYNYCDQFQSAITDFKMVININPNDYNGYFGRGYAKSGLLDFYGANMDYSNAIEKNPKFSMAYNNRGYNLCKLKKYDEALMDVNKAIELDSKNYCAFDSKGEILFYQKKFTECISEMSKAIQINDNDNSYLIRGKAKFQLGDKKGACEDWSKANEFTNKEAYDSILKYCQ